MNIQLSDLYKELFTSPLEAVCETEKSYRKIWAKWIKSQKPFFRKDDGSIDAEQIRQLLNQAPVIELDGTLDVDITVRIASVQKKEGSISGGIRVGPVHSSGKYGFSNESSLESALRASTRFVISNHKADLNAFLLERNLSPTSEEDINRLIKSLEEESNEQ
ncbi:hypothetical protein QLX67_10460 [Balneolaceae bacterium ANBcel3]|nr:hypothetical protein [Balneolaceae bacterium ANBcel3]